MQKEIRQSVNRRSAFTLVELILVVGTIGMVTGALVGVIGNSTKDYEYGSERSTLLQDGQAVLDQMVRTLRQAKAFSAVSASTDQAGFITYTSADDVTEQFKLNTTTDELEYGQLGALDALTGDVTGLTFTCYDTDAVALTGAVDPASIKSVHIAITLTGTQNTVTLTGRVDWPKDISTISPDTGPQYTYPGSDNLHYTLPVAWYKLDGVANDDFVLDLSGNGNHGTLVNGPTLQTGNVGQALDLDGEDDYVELTDRPERFATISEQTTITLWTWGRDTPRRSWAFSAWRGLSTSSDRCFSTHIPWSNGGIYWDSGLSASGFYDRIEREWDDTDQHNGHWNHWAFTKNADTGIMEIYLNGALWQSGTGKTSIIPTVTIFRLGCRVGEAEFHSGKIDDFRIYDVALSAAEVGDVFAGNAVGSPLVWFQFEGMATDSSGNGNHGQLQGPPEIVTGRFDNAFNFDGVNDYVEYSLPDPVTFDAYTVALWARADTLGQNNGTGLFNNSSSDNFQIDMDGGNPGNYRYNGENTGIFGAVTTGWIHLAVTCDGTDTKLYYNGKYIRTLFNVADNVFGRYTFGKNRGTVPASTHYFDGSIDDARVYDVALSDAEIAALYLEWKEGALD